MLSTKSLYAIKALVKVGTKSINGECVSVKDIVEGEDISIKYLEQIIALLVRGNLLISYRGNNGGYKLSKPSHLYNAYEIVCVADGDITKNNITNDNWSKRFFDGFNSSIRNYLKSITLSDLISYYEEEIFAGDYSI